MNCPYCEVSSLSADGQERIAVCQDCRGDWMTNRTGGTLYRDNLIFLPFAAHLADEVTECLSKVA